MTLRDWFDSQALAGIMANSSIEMFAADAAEKAYRCADAMLEERKKWTD